MNIWLELLFALVRAVVQFFLGYLVGKNIIPASQTGHYTDALTVSITAAIVVFLTTVGVSLWNKVRAKVRFLAALQADPGTPAKDVVAVADSTSPLEKIALAKTDPGRTPVQ